MLFYAKYLILSMSIKVILSTCVLLAPNIPMYIKVALIEIVIDNMDTTLLSMFQDKYTITSCMDTYILYQMLDKFTDHTVYLILLILIYSQSLFTAPTRSLLTGFFLYRTIGVLKFFLSSSKFDLVVFPNIYLAAVFSVSLSESFPDTFPYTPTLVTLIVMKLIQEIYLYNNEVNYLKNRA